MNPIQELITKINTSSSTILAELENNEPSFEIIVNELNNREEWVQLLGEYQEVYKDHKFSEREMEIIKSQFDYFAELNTTIQSKAEDLLEIQKHRMVSATKTRKAEQQYQVSQNPNVSYY
jgi:hypothetical protein